jgi:hypothetical protein
MGAESKPVTATRRGFRFTAESGGNAAPVQSGAMRLSDAPTRALPALLTSCRPNLMSQGRFRNIGSAADISFGLRHGAGPPLS